ncbi:hypothetical protein GQ600_24699 [Phytophthora cactorum]|nr:hypothetical protein GQ600_24699 [Phytophthora cactorum]
MRDSVDVARYFASQINAYACNQCCDQYCKRKSLVAPSSTSTRTRPSGEGWAHYEDPVHNYYRRTVCTVSGKLLLWGDPICSLYHQLLQTTLLYCAPGNVSSDVGDILTVSEMQQLPVETLTQQSCLRGFSRRT